MAAATVVLQPPGSVPTERTREGGGLESVLEPQQRRGASFGSVAAIFGGDGFQPPWLLHMQRVQGEKWRQIWGWALAKISQSDCCILCCFEFKGLFLKRGLDDKCRQSMNKLCDHKLQSDYVFGKDYQQSEVWWLQNNCRFGGSVYRKRTFLDFSTEWQPFQRGN